MRFMCNSHRRVRLSLLFVAVFSVQAWAGEPDWLDHKFTFRAQGETLERILADFSVSYGLTSNISDKLKEPIFGDFIEVTPRHFLTTLSRVSTMRSRMGY